jgi:hypothetical protein
MFPFVCTVPAPLTETVSRKPIDFIINGPGVGVDATVTIGGRESLGIIELSGFFVTSG